MKNIQKNLEYIKCHKVRIRIESRHMPGGSQHNLICWMCNRRSAVYSMYPDWIFLPCWVCQSEMEGIWNRDIWKKKWYQFWK